MGDVLIVAENGWACMLRVAVLCVKMQGDMGQGFE